jgi:hypothetical protein
VVGRVTEHLDVTRADHVSARALSLAVVTLGCGTPGAESCTVVTHRDAIVGGAGETGYLGLSAEQSRAVVSLDVNAHGDVSARNLCSAVLLGPDLLLTASHCVATESLSLRIGLGDGYVDASSERVRVVRHASLDVALVHVEGLDAPFALPWANHTPSFEAAFVEVAGAGLTEEGALGSVTFAVARARVASDTELLVELTGSGGPCGGDSGGPLLIRGVGGAVTVAGILMHGSPSCTGHDAYARLDGVAEWLAAEAGEPLATQSACTTLGVEGRCFGKTAVFCEDGAELSEECAGGSVCGWDRQRSGYRCVESGEDPCAGVTDLGSCSGDVARRCSAGELLSLSCEACGSRCGISPRSGKASCW